MTDAGSRKEKLQQLWMAYEAVLWAGMSAVQNQATITRAELDRLIAAHSKVPGLLSQLRELINR